MNQVMEGLVLVCKCISFLDVFPYCELLCLWYHYKHIFERKQDWALLIDLLKVKKNNVLHYCVHNTMETVILNQF